MTTAAAAPPAYAAVASSRSRASTSSTTGAAATIKLYSNASERRKYNELADLYAILKATEHLEVSYSRDAISKEAYTEACSKLLIQYKGAKQALQHDPTLNTIEDFIRCYKAECPRAIKRLIHDGVPATHMHTDHSAASKTGAVVAEAVQQFITVMDQLKLGYKAVDELTPGFLDLLASLNRTPGLADDFEPKLKVHHWVTVLQEMNASDEISDDQARQMALDIDTSYNTYFHSLDK